VSDTEQPAEHIEQLSRHQRQRLVTVALLRTALVATVLVAIYFTLPLERWTGAMTAVAFGAGLLVVAGLLGWQIRATMRARFPGLRAVESLGTSAPFLLLLFATAHFLIDLRSPGSYSEPMTRLDALYLSVTMFTTVGFGDIAPVAEAARVITMLQMLANLIFIGVVARVLFGAALGGRRSE
jgi:voltage-gated potassium channel